MKHGVGSVNGMFNGSVRTKSITIIAELCFADWFHDLLDTLLYQPIPYAWDSQRTCFSVWFRDIFPSYRLWSVAVFASRNNKSHSFYHIIRSSTHPGNDADTLQTIKMVTEQNDKLNRMVKTLLDMSELQTVGRDDKIILDAIVEEVLADLEPLAVEKNIKLIGKCEDATMTGSDILIYRLVYNLVENAIKYNHPLGQVTVTAYQRNKHVYLSVEDTGSGIPKELRERVFEPFFRVDKSRSRELGGVGLGLAFVREIVRVHDGSICIKSGKTGGTIFEVTFAQHSM